ncbi:hypothetical protein D9756_008365 [Leucocoprinus leucothites]|uniref:Uncharacterized protein n=1 Tax=Leucocoprinus leucothites TaxID=201217 RepID=A0A8H5D1W5_9AGAR|nr:hypothetical protein D9756_008365 [Leucoagaricus leucothites]
MNGLASEGQKRRPAGQHKNTDAQAGQESYPPVVLDPLPIGSLSPEMRLSGELLPSDSVLNLGKYGEIEFEDSGGLLQTYLDDERRSQWHDLYLGAAVRRFVDLGQFSAEERASKQQEIRKIIKSLAKHEAIFQNLLSYTDEGRKRKFYKVTYSRIGPSHLALLGVAVRPHVPFKELARFLEQATLSAPSNYPSRTDVNASDFVDVFPKETEVLEMSSTVEANARFRISTILKKVVVRLRQTEIIAFGEELSLGFCGDESGPIEVQHVTSDGTVLSTFISGRLDYVEGTRCGANTVVLEGKRARINHEDNPRIAIPTDYVCFRAPSYQIKKALRDSINVAEALRFIQNELFREFVGVKFVDFIASIEQRSNKSFEAFGLLDGDFRWDVFALEAKHMNERVSYNIGLSSATSTKPAALPRGFPPFHTSDTIIGNDHPSMKSHDHTADTVNVSSGREVPRPIASSSQAQALDSDSLSPLRMNTLFAILSVRSMPTNSWELFHPRLFLMRHFWINISSRFLPHIWEITNTRRLASISDRTDSGPLDPVLGVIHQSDHFYVVVALPRFQEVHILGKGILSLKQYQAENGWDRWKNGFDCGPIASQVAITILRHGFEHNDQGFWGIPALSCAHEMRRSMVLRDPALLESLYRPDTDEMRRQIHDFERNFNQTKSCLDVLEKLDRETLTCEFCGPPALANSLRSACENDGYIVSDESLGEIEVNNLLLEGLSVSADTSDKSSDPGSELLSSETSEEDNDGATEVTSEDNGLSEEDNRSTGGIDSEDRAGKADINGDCGTGHPNKDARRRDDLEDETAGKDSNAPGIRQSRGISSPPTASRASRSGKSSGKKSAKTQHPRDLKKHLPQVIGQCLVMYVFLIRFMITYSNAKIDSQSQKPNIIKFGISSSNDWLFGLLDCTGNTRLCYITDTLTIRTEENLKDVIFLLLTWVSRLLYFLEHLFIRSIQMIVPGHEVLQHFPKSGA